MTLPTAAAFTRRITDMAGGVHRPLETLPRLREDQKECSAAIDAIAQGCADLLTAAARVQLAATAITNLHGDLYDTPGLVAAVEDAIEDSGALVIAAELENALRRAP